MLKIMNMVIVQNFDIISEKINSHKSVLLGIL